MEKTKKISLILTKKEKITVNTKTICIKLIDKIMQYDDSCFKNSLTYFRVEIILHLETIIDT